MDKRLVKIGEAARLLGTDHSTLRGSEPNLKFPYDTAHDVLCRSTLPKL